jgi:hypothetical protein
LARVVRLPPLATSVPPVDGATPAVVFPTPHRAPATREPSFAVELCLLALCLFVWLAGEAHRIPALQQRLMDHAYELSGGARLGAAIPSEPARLVASASSAVKHGLDRFVHEWTLGLAGEMSREEKAELDALRQELNAAEVRAHRVIAALHAREVAQHDYILNRLAWRDWRARRVIASYDEAPPERVALVLAEAARAACRDDCLASLSEPLPASTVLAATAAPAAITEAVSARSGGSTWPTAPAAPAYARPSLVENSVRACRNGPVDCRVPTP